MPVVYLMKFRLLFITNCMFYAACATGPQSNRQLHSPSQAADSQSVIAKMATKFNIVFDPKAIAWSDENIQGLESVSVEQRTSVYYITSIFLDRLKHWQDYQPLYDKIYLENKTFAHQHPYYIDVKNGLYFIILQPNQRLTDLQPYQILRGKSVGEVLLGHVGDKRMYDSMPGEGARQTLIVEVATLTAMPKGTFNTYYHEFGHLIHLSLMNATEFDRIEALYASAKARANFLDDYAALNSSEYFSVGLEAYLSDTKMGTENKWRKHTKRDLINFDPDLNDFIDDLIQSKKSSR